MNTFYECPLCGQEFQLKPHKKTARCGDHTLQVTENKGVLTVQAVPTKTKQKGNVSGASGTL